MSLPEEDAAQASQHEHWRFLSLRLVFEEGSLHGFPDNDFEPIMVFTEGLGQPR